MAEFAEWQDAATPDRQQGRVCFDREAKAELLAVIARISDVAKPGMLDQPDEVEALAQQARDLDSTVEAATKTLTFARIPRRRWRELEQDHPATDEQKAINPRQTINPHTFEPAAAAICCVDPELTSEQAEWLYDFLPDDEWSAQVFGPIWVANKSGVEVPKGVSSIAGRLISELRSITAASEESPSLSSEDV